MIEVYLKTNKNYEANGDITLTPSLCTYKDKEYILTVEHPMDELERWKFLEYENVIKSKGKLYRIYNVVKTLYSVVAYARPIFFDLIDKVLLDVRPTNKNGQKALEMILDGTDFKGHSNITKIRTSHNIRKNIVEALIGDEENSFINRWGGEFYCENFDVYINDRIGNDYGLRVEFGYNLNEIEEDINIEDVATRIIPMGFDGLMLKGKTPWVDSPLITKYIHPKMRVIKFEDVKVKENKDDEEGFNTVEEARAELIKRCKELYDKGIDKPQVNYKIDMVNLANTTAYKDYVDLVTVGKGDTVTCYVKSLDIEVKARVIDFERDELTGEYNYIELGNSQSDFFEDQADIETRINKILNKDGTVNAIEVAGVLNAINVKMRAMKDVAQKQDVRALLCEDLDPESPTYGAMCYGTMGFMIASERTPDNRDWNWRTFGTGKGFFADLIVAGTMLADRIRGGVLESIDGSVQIDLSNISSGIQFKHNGKKAIDILGQTIKFYDWDGEGAPIGQIYSSRFNNNKNMPGIVLANRRGSYLSLAYEKDGQFYAYMRFDKDNVDNFTKAPITIFHDTELSGSQLWFGYDENSIFKSSKKNFVFKTLNEFVVLDKETSYNRICNSRDRTYFANEKGIIYFDVKQGSFTLWDGNRPYLYKEKDVERIWCDYSFAVDKKLHINGDFTVVGNKNCVQRTENYGDRLFYCVEDCESYLTDRSMEVFTVERTEKNTYERVILLDNIFKEAVRTDIDYTIEIFKQGWGDYRIKEQTKDYFIIESDREDFTFKYVVTAKKRYFENERLEEFFNPENNSKSNVIAENLEREEVAYEG